MKRNGRALSVRKDVFSVLSGRNIHSRAPISHFFHGTSPPHPWDVPTVPSHASANPRDASAHAAPPTAIRAPHAMGTGCGCTKSLHRVKKRSFTLPSPEPQSPGNRPLGFFISPSAAAPPFMPTFTAPHRNGHRHHDKNLWNEHLPRLHLHRRAGRGQRPL